MVGRALPPFWIDYAVPLLGMAVCAALMYFVLWG